MEERLFITFVAAFLLGLATGIFIIKSYYVNKFINTKKAKRAKKIYYQKNNIHITPCPHCPAKNIMVATHDCCICKYHIAINLHKKFVLCKK